MFAGYFLIFRGWLAVAEYFGRPDQQRNHGHVNGDGINPLGKILAVLALRDFLIVQKTDFAGQKDIFFHQLGVQRRRRRNNFRRSAPNGTVMRSSISDGWAAARAALPGPDRLRD